MNRTEAEPEAQVWIRGNELITNWDKALRRVLVFDIMGRKVRDIRGDAGSIYTDDLAPGVYLVSLQSDRESISARIMVH